MTRQDLHRRDTAPIEKIDAAGVLETPPPRLAHLVKLGLLGLAFGGIFVGLHMVSDNEDRLLLETLTILDLLALSFLLLLGIRRWREAAAYTIRAQHLVSELETARQSAISANLAKSRYLASVSHEIRSPLNAIYGYAQLFERGDGVNAQEAARVILRCSEHLTNLVEGLLDISQLEFGMLRVRTEEVRLNSFLDHIVSMMRPAAHAKGLTFTLEKTGRLPEIARFDQNRLRQVLINLLSNAIKFTQQGSVTLKVGYAGQIATFEVKDTGPGIAPEDRQRIFEPFERGEGRESGAGLGLAISRTLVEILGGQLDLVSTPEGGSCFRIVMMLSEVAGKALSSAPMRKLTGYEGKPRHVLLVEDDADQRQFLEQLLRGLGFQVEARPDGEQALLAARETPPDLAILDISLPGLSGWEIGCELRAMFGDRLQILMLSANSEELHRPEHDSPQHDRFLVKPVEFESLVGAIGDLLQLTWRWQDDAPDVGSAGPDTPSALQPAPVALDDTARKHIARMQECLRIGHIRGIETEIKQLERASPAAEPLVRQLYQHLDRYDLTAMARLLQDY
ncbi:MULTISPECIES: hybrid sensor histidine kinase/response regulator [unclassified Sphingobium]|uniref:ATP-binding response regulator n=1 Tax=unclassified Sphingobium TaxID=2611147 RepID=UPI002225346F|nr:MULTISPECIES: ATP-binding protein [unclassified Sphingobium]MCW2395555.1 signal transduction histidine kinase/DNA-binding response OmpR family regulator [Sphingobium sp. B8D3B]MCW2419070.1 signal transduction histidine kinase/DNA-binding response OmpR family regulator [Sphingobium sp. B8D3C]